MTGPPPQPALPYVLAEHEVAIGPHHLALVGLADFERTVTELADKVIAEPAWRPWFEDLCPMFGTVWPSARALAEVVARQDVKGRQVLELGCGLALPSLVAALGGADVLASDQHPDAAAFLERNLARNHVTGVRYRSFDWRAEPPPFVAAESFDLVLASDVLYARDMPALVAGAFARYLAPDGVGWLADPGRPWLQEFAAEAAGVGLRAQIEVEGDVFLLRLVRGG
jgi:predicted nicotinamide N-methyase